MQEVNGKWSAYNLDGVFHQCKKKVETVRTSGDPPVTLDQIDVRLKRVEKMLFNEGK